MRLAGTIGWALVASVALSCASPVRAAKLTDTEQTRIDEPRPPGLASDEQMLAEGAVIGKVVGPGVKLSLVNVGPGATFPLPKVHFLQFLVCFNH